MSWWSSEPRNAPARRLAFVDNLGGLAKVAFVASSLGFLPSDAPRPIQLLSRPAINQPHIPDIRKVGVGYLEANKSPAIRPFQRAHRAFNAETPPGARITVAASSFVPSWNDPAVKGFWKSPPAVNEPLTSTAVAFALPLKPPQWSVEPPARLPLVPRRAINDPWNYTTTASFAPKYFPFASEQRTSFVLKTGQVDLSPVFLAAANVYGEPVINDAILPPLQRAPRPESTDASLFQRIAGAPSLSVFSAWSVEPPRHAPLPINETDLSADTFGQLSFGELVQADPPRAAVLRPVRPDNTDPGLQAIGFAPSPTFSGWTVEAPAKAPFQRSRVYPETVLGTLSAPPLGAFADWAPILATGSRLAAPRTVDGSPVGQSLLASPWASWAPDATKPWQPPARAQTDPFAFAPTQPPPGLFTQWSTDASRPAQAASSRVDSAQAIGRALSLSSSFPWATDPQRAPLAQRGPANDTALPALVLPPTEFAVWSVEPPRVWTQPYSRPVNQPIFSAVTLPPFAGFQQWSVDSVRGTAVTSRPPGTSVLTGSALPLPVLTGVPWGNVGPRPTPLASPRPVDSFVGAPLSFGSFASLQTDAPRPAVLRIAPVAADFLGAPLPVLSGFQQWATDAPRPRSASAVRQDSSSTFGQGAWVSPFAVWSADPPRPRALPAAAPERSSFAFAPLVVVSGFVQWSPDAPRSVAHAGAPLDSAWALRSFVVLSKWQDFASTDSRTAYRAPRREPEATWNFTITIPPLVAVFEQWSVEPLRHWSQPACRTGDQPFGLVSFAPPMVTPASADYCSPLVDLRDGQYIAPLVDMRSTEYVSRPIDYRSK